MTTEELLFTKEKANEGSLIAQKILFEHFYAEENYEVALKWARKAAEQGNARAEYLIGECYASGLGVAEDIKEAVKWFARASEKGNADAMLGLAKCYLYNDPDKALKIIESAEINIDARDICRLMEFKAIALREQGQRDEYEEIVRLFSQQGLGCTSCNFIENYDEEERTCPWMVSEMDNIKDLEDDDEEQYDDYDDRDDDYDDRYDDYDDRYDDGVNWDYYDDNLDMDQQPMEFWD